MRMEQEQDAAAADWSEDDLPSADELMPLSQSLITPDLALAFDIPTAAVAHHPNHPYPLQSSSIPGGAGSDFDSSDLNSASAAASGGGGVAGSDEPARTLKRPRLVWTPQLHKRFVDAVAHLGIKNAVPKTIMQLMSVDGLTRENVASHLQKYRLYLKRMQGLSAGGPISAADAATDQLFASAPVPHHFLNRGPVGGPGGPGEPFLPFVPVTALQHHQITSTMQQQQQQQQQPYYQQRHIGHFGSPTSAGGGFDHGFLSRTVPQPGMHRMAAPAPGMGLVGTPPPSGSPYGDDVESSGRGGSGGRKVLTLFPSGED